MHSASLPSSHIGANHAQGLLLKGYTHICIHPIEPNEDTGITSFCHEPIALTKNNGIWIQSGAQRHIEFEHQDAPAAIQSAERSEQRILFTV